MTVVLYVGLFHHMLLAFLVSPGPAFSIEYKTNLSISPQSPVVEIGKNFTATCVLANTHEATADDLVWYFTSKPIPREQYTQINASAVNVTIAITSETPLWLYCHAKKNPPSSSEATNMDGIILKKEYPLVKPENLTCMAVQVGLLISRNITCFWDNGTPRETAKKTTLFVTYSDDSKYESIVKNGNSGQVTLDVFPHHMVLKVWVESENALGKVQSDVLETEADQFVKTNPPSNVKLISENRNFSKSLLITWTPAIEKAYVKLIYQIRFSPLDSHMWIEVPLADTASEIQSFRIQSLRPYTYYVTQVRCKIYREGFGYWSDWSNNASARTPETNPNSKPDLWWTISSNEATKKQMLHILCKEPELSNGRIKSYDIKMQGRPWETFVMNGTETGQNLYQRNPVDLGQIEHPKRIVYAEVIAHNSEGQSPKAWLKIQRNLSGRPPVNKLKCLSREGQLSIQWQPPKPSAEQVTEYVVEWVWGSGKEMDWQREPAHSSETIIRGDLKNFILYNVSVYPLYSDWIGQPVFVEAYLEQGAPLEAPVVKIKYLGSTEAVVEWNKIPLEKRRGFIVNYTIYYSTVIGSTAHVIQLSKDTYSYHMKELSSNTKYRVMVKASTVTGSITSPEHLFNTVKYEKWQITGILLGFCLGFLGLVICGVLVWFYKRDSIKSTFWPTIPNPGHSGIGTWSPDFHLNSDTPKENPLVDLSVVEVAALDGKSVFEEDKAGLALKKDKYLSEEHSSGIGDSSCMSSPRQSASDSDEGGDPGEAAAGVVQYSSVVASQGYKGQNPGALLQHSQHHHHQQQHQHQQQQQPPSFSRSESTQPLLDSEDSGDVLGTSGQSRHLSPGTGYRSSAFRPGGTNCAENGAPGEQDSSVLLRFWPLDEACQQSGGREASASTELLEAVPVSRCMTKLGSYRPQ